MPLPACTFLEEFLTDSYSRFHNAFLRLTAYASSSHTQILRIVPALVSGLRTPGLCAVACESTPGLSSFIMKGITKKEAFTWKRRKTTKNSRLTVTLL